MFKKKFIELLLSPLVALNKDSLNSMYGDKNTINFLLFWNKESLGFFVSNRTFIKIIKDYIPNAKITLLVNRNKLSLVNKPEIYDLLGLKAEDEILTIIGLFKKRSKEFDVAISPSLKKFSFINHLILRFFKAKRKIGFGKVNDNINPYLFALNSSVNFTWKDNPDIHFSEILINLLLPLGFQLESKSPELKFFNLPDVKRRELLNFYGITSETKIIGINNNSEDLLSKWDSENIIRLLELFNISGKYFFYFIANSVDSKIFSVLQNRQNSIPILNKKNPLELINLLAVSNLFITCDSEIMHLAGSTTVPQISIFGKRNPFNWAPLGKNKVFISKADGVNDIGAEEVFDLSINLLMRERE